MAKAYIIVNAARRDELQTSDAYLAKFRETLAAHGGRVLIGTEQIDQRKGDNKLGRLVAVEFGDKNSAQAAYEQYQCEAMRLRPGGTRDLYIVEGVV